MNTSSRLDVYINPGSVFKAALVLIGIYVAYLLRDVVLVVIAAIVIASAIEPLTLWFTRHRIPRTIGVIITYISIAAIIFGAVYLVLPSLLSDAASFLSQAPQYAETVDAGALLQRFNISADPSVLQGLSDTFSAGDLISGLRTFIAIPGGVFRIVSSVFGGVFSFVLVIVLSFYFAVQERGIEQFIQIVAPVGKQAYAIDLWQRSQRKIGQWMQGQLLLMLLVGVLVFLGLTILGIKHAFLFALLAGAFEVIPLFGPVLSSIPPLLVAFSDGGASLVLMVAGLFVIIQQFENHLIYPLVVNKVVGIPSMVVILALVVGGQLGGFLGALLSVPIAAALMELFHDVKVRAARMNSDASSISTPTA